MEYLVWPNGDYCEPEDLQEALLFGKSDDFELIKVEDDAELDREIRRIVNRRTPLEAL
jgi:hypothetical protein